MRVETTHNGRTVVAISGKHAIALALKWPAEEFRGLIGFAIRRTGPDRVATWLQTVLRFAGESIEKGRLYDSVDAPIQSMIWNDFGLSENKQEVGLPAGTRFVYEVIPMHGRPGALKQMHRNSVRIAVSTEPEHEPGSDQPEVHFNRGLSDSQEYERLFGEGHIPDKDTVAMKWLARDLELNIVAFIEQATLDKSMLIDVAAYHLDHKKVIKAICKVGKRARVSLDWGAEERISGSPGPNSPAHNQLKKSGVFVHKREHVSISHNKYMILKQSDGTPVSVLTGSTNFTNGGISTQSNQSVIVHNRDIAKAYLKDFERVLKNDNAGLRRNNKSGAVADDTLEVYFSPHSMADRPDLDRLTKLAMQATSSRLFMTFRMTDSKLIESVLNDDIPVFGVADRAYYGTDHSGDRLIFNEAHTANPRVVACNAPLEDEPDEDALYLELKRNGYNPIVHHKILLFDWDKPDCVVVTGSANYSTNSTAHNDENSLIIHGDQRLAEEYFVEFCRLFTHWRPRWLIERQAHVHPPEQLASSSSWTKSWAPGGRMAEFLDVAVGDVTKNAADPEITSIPKFDPARAGSRSIAGERIKHVVVLMLENRSFDHMLGYLPGVDGIANNRQSCVNYLDPRNPSEKTAFHVEKARYFGIPEGDIPPPVKVSGIETDLYGGPSHSFPAASEQLYNDEWGPAGAGVKGATPTTNNGFVKAYAAGLMRDYQGWADKDPNFKMPIAAPRDHVAVAMNAFTPRQLPVINGLAKAFCVCDKWFSEVPGPTEPNRLFMHAATSVGLVHNPWEFPIEARTIYEDIDEQGDKSWAFYSHDLSDASNFPALKTQVDRLHPFDKFAKDLMNPNDFPNYVFLCPRYSNSRKGFANSQHAPYDVRFGEHWIADVYENLRHSKIWEQTLLIVTYDEHGGFFDHVYPPDKNVLPPDAFTSPTAYDRQHYGYMFNEKTGQPKPQYVFNFDRLGCRVPTILISPWLDEGMVESRQLQHTSVLASVRKMWRLRDQPLTAREGQAATFDDLLESRDKPRNDCPLKLKRPALPKVSLSAALDEPLSPVQKEVFSIVNHLDGHPDSGKPAPVPKTQGEASVYIAQRNQAHRLHHLHAAGEFNTYKDKSGAYRWKLVATGGEVVARSAKGFKSIRLARQEIAKVKQNAQTAFIK